MEYKLIPYPQKIEEKEGKYEKGIAYRSDKNSALHDSIAKLFTGKAKRGTILLSYDEDIKEEGYILSIAPDKVEIKAKDDRGHYYGAQTLKQLQEQFGACLPCLTIEDYPVSTHRGIQVNYGQANVKFNRDWLCYFIEKCGAWRINYLYLYFEWNYSFESVKGLSNPFYANRADMEYIIAFAKARNVEIVPQFNFLGHSSFLSTKEKFAPVLEAKQKNAPLVQSADICIGDEKNYQFIQTLIDEICEVFPSPVIHIGGDEVAHMGLCEACAPEKEKYGVLGMYLKHFKRLSDYMKAKGKKIGLWGDILLMLCEGSPFWTGRDVEPQFAEQNLALLYEFKDNLIIYDWWYFGVSKISLDFFKKHGIETVASTSTMGCYCSCLNPGQYTNFYNFYQYAQEIGAYGTLITDWINHLGYHGEQMTAHFASASAISWSGCKDGFVQGVTYESFLKEFCAREYGTEKAVEYIRFAGDFGSPLFEVFDAHFRGVGLRHGIFHAQEPIGLYCKTYPFLSQAGALEKYETQVKKLQSLWAEMRMYSKNKYNALMELPAIMHGALLDYYKVISDIHGRYHEASLLQYEDDKAFKKAVAYCSKKALELIPVYEKVLAYAKQGFALVGNDYASVLRLQALIKNIKKWSKFIGGLKDNHRPLPSFSDTRSALFGAYPTSLYSFGELDWFTEKSEFFSPDYYNDGSAFVNEVDCFNVCQNV